MKAYVLAYQILGDILFRAGEIEINSKILKEYDIKLGDWSYEIIWSELTGNEKKILSLVANGHGSNAEILEKSNMSKGNLAIYKKKLADEGLLNVSIRGKSEFSLPRFDSFIKGKEQLEED